MSTVEVLDNTQFQNNCLRAFEASKLFDSIEKFKKLINELLENPDSEKLKNGDPLTNFIKYCIKLKISPEVFINEKILQILSINTPWAIIINNNLTTSWELHKLLNWKRFIYRNKMLLFFEENLILCDITNCNSDELEKQFNPEAITWIETLATGEKSATEILQYLVDSTFQQYAHIKK